jgi:hypothetical protein
MQLKKVCLSLLLFAVLTVSVFSVASADGVVNYQPQVEVNFLLPSANSTTTTTVRNPSVVASTTTVVPGISSTWPATMEIPDEPGGGNWLCGTSQLGNLILAKDGWNYKCTKSGDRLLWKQVDCVFSGITCITLPPNQIQPQIGTMYLMEGYPNLYGKMIVFGVQTSTGAVTRKILEISIDSEFQKIVFVGDHETFYDASWRCDVRMCTEGYYFYEYPAINRLIGVTAITGSFYARATVINSVGIARQNFGLISLPGPQMLLPANFATTTTAPTSNTTSSTTTTTTTTTIAPVVKRTSITCVKGKRTKVVKGFNPKCPSGYMQK